MSFPNCNIDESKIVCIVKADGSIWSKKVVGNITICVKVPDSGPFTFHKLKSTPHGFVIFTPTYASLKGEWIEGLPDGFEGHDCTDDKGINCAVITTIN